MAAQWRPTPPRLEPGECRIAGNKTCELCWAGRIEYPMELELKRVALQAFWTRNRLPGQAPPIWPAESGRYYRGLSKRRALKRGQHLVLCLVEQSGYGLKPIPVHSCRIEPPEHTRIFQAAQASPALNGLTETLRFVILRDKVLILNLERVDAHTVRAARKLCKALPRLEAAYVARGKQDSHFYLDTDGLRKLFGSGKLGAEVCGRRFSYPPDAFAQVQSGMLEPLVQSVDACLTGQGSLVDLYCGWGVLGLSCRARPVLGIEVNRPSLQAARENARRHKTPSHWICAPIEAEELGSLIPYREDFEVILDPPRGGCPAQVQMALAALKPRRVAHVFCDIEQIPTAVKLWNKSGYDVSHAAALDMFAGIPQLEMVLGLQRRPAHRRRG